MTLWDSIWEKRDGYYKGPEYKLVWKTVLQDDFDDGDISDWVDLTGQNCLSLSSSIYHSSPYSLEVKNGHPYAVTYVYKRLTDTLTNTFHMVGWGYIPATDTAMISLWNEEGHGYTFEADSQYKNIRIIKRTTGGFYQELARVSADIVDGQWLKMEVTGNQGNMTLVVTQGSNSWTATAFDDEFTGFERFYVKRSDDTPLYYDDLFVEGYVLVEEWI